MNKFKVTMKNGGVFVYETKRIKTVFEMLDHLINMKCYSEDAITGIEKLPSNVYEVE